MQFIFHLLYLVFAHRLIYLVLSIAVGVGVLVYINKDDKYSLTTRKIFVFNAAFAIINLFIGSFMATYIVYKLGEKGIGKVTGTFTTGVQYNRHNVVGYCVLIKTAQGQTVESSFEDDDFNVYPPSNGVYYPGVGDVFTAIYLKEYPKDFIIVNNDNTHFALDLRCQELRKKVGEAREKYEFDTQNQTFRTDYTNAILACIDSKCYMDSTDLEEYYREIEKIKAGKP